MEEPGGKDENTCPRRRRDAQMPPASFLQFSRGCPHSTTLLSRGGWLSNCALAFIFQLSCNVLRTSPEARICGIASSKEEHTLNPSIVHTYIE